MNQQNWIFISLVKTAHSTLVIPWDPSPPNLLCTNRSSFCSQLATSVYLHTSLSWTENDEWNENKLGLLSPILHSGERVP